MKKRFQFLNTYKTVLRVIGLCLLFLIAFSYAMFQGGFVSWFVFYSSLPVLLNGAFVLFYPLRDIHVQRDIRKHELFGGETLHVTIEITRRLPSPLFYLIIHDQLPGKLAPKEIRTKIEQPKGLFSPGFRRKMTFTYEVKQVARGDYPFSSIVVQTGDFFGFIQKKREILVKDTVTVYPKLYPLDEWKPLDLSYGGSHRSKKHFEHDLTSLSSVRDYTPGDRLSWLDWKATARVNRLVTKQFEFPLNRDVIVVFNTFNDGKKESLQSFEYSVSLVATLVDRATTLGASVGFMAIAKESTYFELSNLSMNKWRIFNYLVSVESGGQGEVTYALSKYLQKLPHQATIVYVTTQTNEKDIELFNDISSRGLAIEIFYVDERTLNASLLSYFGRMQSQGMTTHHIKSTNFNQELKAGGSRATS